MQRSRIILAAAIALVTAGARVANAAAPVDINLDFSKPADQAKLMLNGNAAWVNGQLELTNDNGQAGSAFLLNPVDAASATDYLATFQFEVKPVDPTDPTRGPADGMAFVSQGAGPDKVEGGGGSLGYVGSDFVPFSYGVEFNTYDGQGLQNGIDQTVAWDAFGVRNKFDQTRFPGIGFLDAGVFTAQVRVQPDKITVTISGGMTNLSPTVALTSNPLPKSSVPADVAAGMPLFAALTPKPAYFGFTGATGGAGSIQHVLNLRIQSPAPAAAPAPAAPAAPAPTAGP